jgi:DMSO reductase family type II enzyme heme b subunit
MASAGTARLTWPAVVAALVQAAPAQAKPGDAERGEALYAARGAWCHGEDGEGIGPGAERLNPPPRDFTMAQYKIKTTGHDDIVPNDEDLFRMIRDGMPATAMPPWGDVFADQDMWDLVAYIKTFGGLEEEAPSDQLDYGTQVPTSAESVAAGKALFEDRCAECHGLDGKGNAEKKLKDDAGDRTWPRNLTKPWTFRASNAPKDIFSRISVGIPGTQMPSFADPKSKKNLTVEERWHVANYAHTLAESGQAVNPENTVVKAARVDGALPETAADPRWQDSAPTTYFLVPQIIAKERLFTPSNDTVTARALYNGQEIALLLEWDDRTKSIPGDPKAEEISDPDIAEDAIAVQLPLVIPDGMEKPYFVMGDASHPVNIWKWKSGTTEQSQSVRLLNAWGLKDFEERDAAAAGLRASGSYSRGTWRVIMTRPLSTGDPEADIQLVAGRFIPIAFAAWDGSNSETGSKHTLTTWYWLQLEPPFGLRPYLVAGLVILLVAGFQLLWLCSASRKAPGGRS